MRFMRPTIDPASGPLHRLTLPHDLQSGRELEKQ